MQNLGEGTGEPTSEAALEGFARDLVEAVEAALPGWVQRCVLTRAAQAEVPVSDEVLRATRDAARQATGTVTDQLAQLFGSDIDDQNRSPMEVLRSAVRYPTAVLRWMGVPPVLREEFEVREFPDDDYALTPASFGDIDDALHEPGLRWGAAKAHVHLARRRGEQSR